MASGGYQLGELSSGPGNPFCPAQLERWKSHVVQCYGGDICQPIEQSVGDATINGYTRLIRVVAQ
jgi:hypothetical protein